jgi:AcrR family transcriptional regulator
MGRPAEVTRESIVKAATDLFAENGFDGASVRDIVSKARVNQAAVNYHFKSKDGLYAEVLTTAFKAFTRHPGFDPDRLRALPRDEAVREFVYQQLRPLLFRDEMSRYIRIFAWENVRPTKTLRKIMSKTAVPYLNLAVELVRRFLPPGTSDQHALCSAIWLVGQCSVFTRNREQFARAPFGLKIDEAFVERLADLITGLALRGLNQVH